MTNKTELDIKIADALDEIDKRVRKAVVSALIGVKDDLEVSKKDFERFKTDCQNEVKKLSNDRKRENEQFLNSVEERLSKILTIRFDKKWKSLEGKIGGHNKAHNERFDKIEEALALEIPNIKSTQYIQEWASKIFRHRSKTALILSFIAILLNILMAFVLLNITQKVLVLFS